MKTQKIALSAWGLSALLVLAVAARVVAAVGYFPNLSPLDAIALFSGACLASRLAAFGVPLVAVLASDLVVNRIYLGAWTAFYPGFYWQYGCYLLIALLGAVLISRIRSAQVIAAGVASAALFFAVSNFGVWASGALYPHTGKGLVACYIAAVPFFKNTLLGDVFYSAILFGGWAAWARRRGAVHHARKI